MLTAEMEHWEMIFHRSLGLASSDDAPPHFKIPGLKRGPSRQATAVQAEKVCEMYFCMRNHHCGHQMASTIVITKPAFLFFIHTEMTCFSSRYKLLAAGGSCWLTSDADAKISLFMALPWAIGIYPATFKRPDIWRCSIELNLSINARLLNASQLQCVTAVNSTAQEPKCICPNMCQPTRSQ